MRTKFQFRLVTTAAVSATLEIEACSINEAREKFAAHDLQGVDWEIADPASLAIEATVTSITGEDGTEFSDEEWMADEEGRWKMPA